MKKFLFLSSIAALTLASCSDDFAPGNNLNPQVEGKSVAYVNFPLSHDDNTRTVLDGRQVTFEIGDAIGLFSETSGSGVQNAPFVYKYNKEGAEAFVGQIYLTPETNYYAYYPYSQTQALGDEGFTFIINPEQSFNEILCTPIPSAQYDWTSTVYDGSFSNNTVPAYAVAEATTKSDISFTMNGLSAFLVIPVTGYTETPIQQITLSLSNSGVQQTIAGSFNIDPATYEYNPNSTDPKYTVGELEGDTGKVITLNCGEGLTLNIGEIVNLWFVVPAGITFDTAIIKFVDGVEEESQHEFSRNLGENTTYTTKVNTPARLGQTKTTPFEYIQGGSAPVPNALTFLEYANLVTNGIDAISENYNSLVQSNDVSLALSSLNTFLKGSAISNGQIAEGATLSAETLRNALVLNKINLSPANVLAEIQEALGIDEDDINIIILPPYFQYLKDYINNKGLSKSIGGAASFTISGLQNPNAETGTDNNVQIQNLQVNANGLFTFDNTLTTIEGLTFTGCKVNVTNVTGTTDYYLFSDVFATTSMGYKAGVVLDDVIAGTGCDITGNTGGNEALFNVLWSANMSLTSNVTNNAKANIPAFANTLNMQPNYPADFVTYSVNEFNTLYITGNGAQAIITGEENDATVGEGNAAIVMEKVAANSENETNDYGYSIYSTSSTTEGDVTTATPYMSYWTGTSYDPTSVEGLEYVFAENLAWAVQQTGQQTYYVNLNMNLDLMGSYGTNNHTSWWAYGEDGKTTAAKVVSVNGMPEETQYTISNVYIDGTLPEGKTTQYLTLLGRNSIVNNLEVNGMTINYAGEDLTAVNGIAAISRVPNTGSGLVTVTNYSVNVGEGALSAQNQFLGGLYCIMSSQQTGYIDGNSTLKPSTADGALNYGDYAYGNIAGSLRLDVDGSGTKEEPTNPIVGNLATLMKTNGAFGQVTLNITVSDNNPYIDLSDLSISGDIKDLTLTIASGIPGNNYTVYVIYDNKTYVYTYAPGQSNNGFGTPGTLN